jgi:hypothetical protein
MDEPVDNGFTDHRIFKQLKPTLGLDLDRVIDEKSFKGRSTSDSSRTGCLI